MIFYVDTKNGNNNNNGLSPAFPKKNLAPFQYNSSRSQSLLKPGDKILIKRGSKLYGSQGVWNSSESTTRPIYIGAYGAGENPIFSCAKEVTQNVYTSLGNNIYSISLTDTTKFGGYKGVNTANGDCNVGYLYDNINKKLYGNRVFAMNQLKNQFDFYVENGTLYIYSTANPYIITNELFIAVYGGTQRSLLSFTNNAIYENLTFTECSGHGMEAVASSGNSNIEVKNCKFINLGGALWQNQTRLGNGLEIYGNGNNINVHHCLFDNCYDTATTIQGENVVAQNIAFTNNIFTKNSQALEVWISLNGTKPTNFGLNNILFSRNICMNQGYGFGARPNGNNFDILFGGIDNNANTDMTISHNIFYNAKIAFYYTENLSGKNFKFFDNKMFNLESKKINTAYNYTNLQLAEYQQTTGQEQNSIITTFKEEYKQSYYETLLYLQNLLYEESNSNKENDNSIIDFPLWYKDVGSYAYGDKGSVTKQTIQRIGDFIFFRFTFTPTANVPAWTTFMHVPNAEFMMPLDNQQYIVGSNNAQVNAFGSADNSLYFQSQIQLNANTAYTVTGFVPAQRI